MPLFAAAVAGRIFCRAFVAGMRFLSAASARLIGGSGFRFNVPILVRMCVRSLALEGSARTDLF